MRSLTLFFRVLIAVFAFLYFQELPVIPWAIIVTQRFQPKIATMITARETVLRHIKEAGGSTRA